MRMPAMAGGISHLASHNAQEVSLVDQQAEPG